MVFSQKMTLPLFPTGFVLKWQWRGGGAGICRESNTIAHLLSPWGLCTGGKREAQHSTEVSERLFRVLGPLKGMSVTKWILPVLFYSFTTPIWFHQLSCFMAADNNKIGCLSSFSVSSLSPILHHSLEDSGLVHKPKQIMTQPCPFWPCVTLPNNNLCRENTKLQTLPLLPILNQIQQSWFLLRDPIMPLWQGRSPSGSKGGNFPLCL